MSYTIKQWDISGWEDTPVGYTNLSDANKHAQKKSEEWGADFLFAVFEDGRENPWTIFWKGRQFDRLPEDNDAH